MAGGLTFSKVERVTESADQTTKIEDLHARIWFNSFELHEAANSRQLEKVSLTITVSGT